MKKNIIMTISVWIIVIQISIITFCAYSVSSEFQLSEVPGIENVQSNKDIYGVIGDADYNNRINIKDATLIQKNIAFLIAFNENQSIVANVNFDSGVNIKDATVIQKWCAFLSVNEPINYVLYRNNIATESTVENSVPETDAPTTNPEVTKYTVTFKDYDGTVLKTETVESGKAATAPEDPIRSGYSFTGWDKAFNNITADTTVTATYVENNVPMLIVSSANATAGATKVTLTVSLQNNPGFLTMALKTTFDSDALILTKVTTGMDYLDYSFTGPKNKVSGCTAAWFASDLPEEIIDGDIMTLQFTVNSDVAPGKYPVTISCPDDGSTVDGNKTEFNMPDAVGYVTIA